MIIFRFLIADLIPKSQIKNQKSEMLKGVAASPGVAIGRAFLFHHKELNVPRYTVDESAVEDEIGRFRSALRQTEHELEEIHKKSEQEMSEANATDHARIFQAHLLILKDPMFVDEVILEIRHARTNAEFAVTKVVNGLVKRI